MSASAEWVSVSEVTRPAAGSGSNSVPLVYDRQPGIYLNAFTLTIKATNNLQDLRDNASPKSIGIWKIPYDVAPHMDANKVSNNSTHIENFGGAPLGAQRSVTQRITASSPGCYTGCAANGGSSSFTPTLNANYKYWYRVYPGDGSVTASNGSGSAFGKAATVTFATPTECSWPTYYNGTNSYNRMKTGSLWPDVLVSYSTSAWPADPTYNSHNVRATYSSSTKKTTALLNLAANQTYYVSVRLAVDNGYSDRKDVEYGTVSYYTYYTYTAPTASPATGTYTTPQKITLSGAAGTTIRYTTNGNNPTSGSPAYSGAIPVNSTTTIKAGLFSGNTLVSPVSTYTYTVNIPAVTASPGSGSYWNTQEVSLSCANGYELYYSVDGSAPTKENGTKYTAPLQLAENTKIRVQRYFDGEPAGSVVDLNYTINIPSVKADPSPGAVGQGTKITLSPAAGNAANNDLYYTETDTLPYDKWAPYTAPIEITQDTTLYAVARDKISGRYGEKAIFTYQYSELGYILNDLSFWQGSTKVTSKDIAALAGKTVTARANITKIIPSIQGWLVTALYDPSGHAQQIKLDKLDQISGIATGDAVGKPITLPSDTTNYVLKTFIVYDFAQLRPMGNIVQIGTREE